VYVRSLSCVNTYKRIRNHACAGADIEFCEGEDEFFENNTHLGEFELSGLPLRPAGEITINLTMKIDKNGILTVTADAEGTNIKQVCACACVAAPMLFSGVRACLLCVVCMVAAKRECSACLLLLVRST
jgi:hypothetical protein